MLHNFFDGHTDNSRIHNGPSSPTFSDGGYSSGSLSSQEEGIVKAVDPLFSNLFATEYQELPHREEDKVHHPVGSDQCQPQAPIGTKPVSYTSQTPSIYQRPPPGFAHCAPVSFGMGRPSSPIPKAQPQKILLELKNPRPSNYFHPLFTNPPPYLPSTSVFKPFPVRITELKPIQPPPKMSSFVDVMSSETPNVLLVNVQSQHKKVLLQLKNPHPRTVFSTIADI